MDFLLLLLWFYCISSFCFLLLLVFSRCCRHCLSFCPFALRSPFAFCNFRKNSLFKKGQAWQRNQGTITSTPTITTTSTTPPSHHGNTHPWCIPLCLCPCANEDDDDVEEREQCLKSDPVPHCLQNALYRTVQIFVMNLLYNFPFSLNNIAHILHPLYMMYVCLYVFVL